MSFVSLCRVFPIVHALLGSNKRTIYLVGPRFRTNERGINGGNIIESGTMRVTIIRGVVSLVVRGGCALLNLSFSPVGNPRNGVRCLYRVEGARDKRDLYSVATRRIIRGSCGTLGR